MSVMDNDRGVIVISCFDGMSCGQIALEKVGISVKRYYAVEIDKYAISVAKTNYPNTIHLGCIVFLRKSLCWSERIYQKALNSKYIGSETKARLVSNRALLQENVYLLMGGSPCQGFSFAGKKLNFDDPRSKLFFEFLRIKERLQPKYFMLENVRMKQESKVVISRLLNINPLEINSSLLSAQNRVRLYWTNIGAIQVGVFGNYEPGIPQPPDRKMYIKDILEPTVDDKYYLSDKMLQYLAFKRDKGNFANGKINYRFEEDKASTITANYPMICTTSSLLVSESVVTDLRKAKCLQVAGKGKGGKGFLPPRNDGNTWCLDTSGRQSVGVPYTDKDYSGGKYFEKNMRSVEGKANALLSNMHKGAQANGCTLIDENERRVIQLNQTKESGGIQPYQQNRVYDVNGISPCLLAAMSSGTHAILEDNIPLKIRRFTPKECERLQTVPDDYTASVSDTQRYRMLGNGWTVDVIAYIFSYLKKELDNGLHKHRVD